MSQHYPLTKLPPKIDRCLFLIAQELKSRAFFDGLHRVGVEDVYLQPHLDQLILKCVGLDDGTDETAAFYFRIMERRSKKVKQDGKSVVKQAVKVYLELLARKAGGPGCREARGSWCEVKEASHNRRNSMAKKKGL